MEKKKKIIEGGGKAKNKIYHSLDEFKKEYFPKSYEKELEEKERSEAYLIGTGLTKELIENLKERVSK